MKTWANIVVLSLTLLVVCGCEGLKINGPCNVSLGHTRGVLIHNTENCVQPGLVVLPDGNLLAAYQCNFSMVSTQLSMDKGATWGTPTTFQLGLSLNYLSLSLLPNGKLFLSTSTYSQLPLPFYMIGTIGPGDTISWGPPVFVSTPAWKYGCLAGSPLVLLANGSLLWPLSCYSDNPGNGGYPNSSTILLSADGGVTWQTQITVGDATADNRDYDESEAAVYPNGDIVLIIRQTTTEPYGVLWRSKSTDNGLSWSKPVLVVDNRIVGRPTLALLPSGALVLLGRAEVDGASTTGFGTSWDEGLTYSYFADLGVRGPSGKFDDYDAMALLPDGSIGVVTAHGYIPDKSNIDYRNLANNCPSPSVLLPGISACFGLPQHLQDLLFASPFPIPASSLVLPGNHGGDNLSTSKRLRF